MYTLYSVWVWSVENKKHDIACTIENDVNFKKISALHAAVSQKSLQALKKAIQLGADVKALNKHAGEILHLNLFNSHSSTYSSDGSIIPYSEFINYHALPPSYGCSDDIARMSALLDAGLDPNSVNYMFGENTKNASPLVVLAANSDIEVLKFLYTYKANFEAKDYSGITPLISSCLRGVKMYPEFLLDTVKVDPNNTDHEGNTALIMICRGCNDPCEIIELLIARNANPRHKNNKMYTALDYARLNTAGHFQEKMIKLLETHGAT